MAGPRESKMLSVMSSIKCAGCGKAIDIMTLADHICEADQVSAPTAPAPKFNLFGGLTASAPAPAAEPAPPVAEKPSIGGFFGWRKAVAPPAIDTSNANRSYDATPELSGSDYSDDENRSASPVTPSTQITSPGSTWSRGMAKEARLSDSQSQRSPSSEKPLSDETSAETTTRLGGLFGTGGLFKRINNTAAGPFVSNGSEDATTKTPSAPSESPYDFKPKFRNAAGRDQLKMSNKPPSPMVEVFGSKAPAAKSKDLFADIQDSNPFSSAPRGRSNTVAAVTSPSLTREKDGLAKSNSARAPAKTTKFQYFDTPSTKESPAQTRRNFSYDLDDDQSASTSANQRSARPAQERTRAPRSRTDGTSLRSERPPPASRPVFDRSERSGPAPRGARPKMFPEARPLGSFSAPAPRPAAGSRFARTEQDMYMTSMASTPSSVNSSPERKPFARTRQGSSEASALSSNASVSSGGTPRHMCRGCSLPIVGRSLRDSSGRLTGRYHANCFRCSCCTAPLPLGEFYVLGNEPLCKRDYHERNGTQCSRCRGGIEGRYVQTDRREMFHDGCFCCSECDINLGEEYWEVGGRPMCQQHAMAMQARARPALAPGRMNSFRNPQKRQTRYGIMAAGGGSFRRQ